jgi:nucleoid DNA-binding protein
MRRKVEFDTVLRALAREVTLELERDGYAPLINVTEETIRKFVHHLVRAAFKGRVTIPDLGTFEVRYARARKLRNPVTHEMMKIEARWALKFKAARKLRGVGHAKADL